ncbi:regulatory protein RecX [Hydrogenophaga soli]
MREPSSSRPGAALSLKGRALRWLSQREHTRQELARKLAAHAEPGDDLDALLDGLTAQGWLSDARAADSVVHRLSARHGMLRIRQALKSKGVAPELTEDALAALKATELDRAAAIWQRKFGVPPADPKERAKQLRFLMARGFDATVAGRVVGGVQRPLDEDGDLRG